MVFILYGVIVLLIGIRTGVLFPFTSAIVLVGYSRQYLSGKRMLVIVGWLSLIWALGFAFKRGGRASERVSRRYRPPGSTGRARVDIETARRDTESATERAATPSSGEVSRIHLADSYIGSCRSQDPTGRPIRIPIS